MAQEFESHFSEFQEVTLGRRFPSEGGAEAWVEQSGGEPMPIKYGLESICEHPALKDQKSVCETHAATYCKDYLTKSGSNDGFGSECTPPQKPECTWDLDCLP